MSEERNPWLPVVRNLAREVAVEDYIHDVDGRMVRLQPVGLVYRRLVGALAGLLVLGLLATASAYLIGCRWIGPQNSAILSVLYRVEPHPERWTERDMFERLSGRRNVMDLLDLAASPQTSPDLYPYIAEMTGHPSPLVEPGRGPALVLLANTLDAFPAEQRGRLVDRIVSVAVALGDSDVQQALSALSTLDGPVRRALFDNGAARLRRIIQAQTNLQMAEANQRSLADEVDRQRKDIQEQASWISGQLIASKRWIEKAGSIGKECQHARNGFDACLRQAENHITSVPSLLENK